jgi:hypothetical protein
VQTIATKASAALGTSTTGSGATVLQTSPTITTPTISTVTSAAATALTLQSAGTTAVTITTAQNVGIGTTNPAAWGGLYKGLDINTYGQFAGSTGGAVWLGNNFYYDGTNYIYKNTAAVSGYLQSGGGHNWYTVASGTAGNSFSFSTPVMQIDANGKVAIGGTGNFGQLSVIQAGAGGYSIGISSASNGGTYYHMNFLEGSTGRGSITSNGSVTLYNTTSDYRLKENVLPMVGALNKVSALKPVTYDWAESKVNGQGFIAHELQAVIPDAVVGTKDAVDSDGNPMYQQIDTSVLVATLTAAIQELNAKVDAQAATIALLQAKVA